MLIIALSLQLRMILKKSIVAYMILESNSNTFRIFHLLQLIGTLPINNFSIKFNRICHSLLSFLKIKE